ncbi:MAG: hypothetical protein ACKOPM_04055 [Novosphingobium sp.]
MNNSNKFDLAIKLTLVSLWVFLIGMAVTNDEFRQILLHPFSG